MSNTGLDFNDAKTLRVKAEEKLQKNAIRTKPLVETDVKRLLHELQVHQIELEMQNEELHQANETAEAALKKYTILYDFAPMGYFTLEADGSISDLNFTGAEILGDKRFSLIGSNFKLFVADDSKIAFNDFFRNVYMSNAKESCNVVLGYEDITLCSVYMEGFVIEEGQKCLLSVIDISKFKK